MPSQGASSITRKTFKLPFHRFWIGQDNLALLPPIVKLAESISKTVDLRKIDRTLQQEHILNARTNSVGETEML